MGLANKHIIVGITGGIAAYKAAELVRQYKKQGAIVRVIMTHGAKAFITPLTLQALSGYPVHEDLLDATAEAGMGHIELARFADLIVIAPATADVIARLAHGHANDLLTTVCLATKAPIAIAPAMNQQMWRQPVTQENIVTLKNRGFHIWGPDEGEQACGDTGFGRLLEPEALRKLTEECFQSQSFAGLSVMITAGPTIEAIDPVRYISNHSSGKMGYALAEAAIEAGARVTLVSGPTHLAAPADVNLVQVQTALEMQDAVMTMIREQNIFIAAAAVADYRVAEPESTKIKKTTQQLQLNLVKNPDIVSEVANLHNRPFTVGFAAETHDLIAKAKEKLHAKNLDMIIANQVGLPGLGFNSDNNAVTVIWKDGQQIHTPMAKTQLARLLLKKIKECFHEKNLT